MRRDLKKQVMNIMEQEDRVESITKGLQEYLAKALKMTSEGAQYFGEDSVVMFFVLPIEYRKYTGAQEDSTITIDIMFGTEYYTASIEFKDTDDWSTRVGVRNQPIKTVYNTIRELVVKFLSGVKMQHDSSARGTVN